MDKFVLGMVVGVITGIVVGNLMVRKIIEQDVKTLDEQNKLYHEGFDDGARQILTIAKLEMHNKTVQDLVDYYEGTKWEV